MKHITIRTSTEERDAVMGNYGINPEDTHWTLHERNRHTWEIADLCRTRRQARAMWLEMFAEWIDKYRSTDEAILEVESEFLKA